MHKHRPIPELDIGIYKYEKKLRLEEKGYKIGMALPCVFGRGHNPSHAVFQAEKQLL